jgi:hypothetical protein
MSDIAAATRARGQPRARCIAGAADRGGQPSVNLATTLLRRHPAPGDRFGESHDTFVGGEPDPIGERTTTSGGRPLL